MDRVWGYTSVLDTGTVTVHIRRLREKIENDPSHPRHLETVLGQRLPVHAVTEVAVFLALGTVAVGIVAALLLRLLPTVRLQLAGLALFAVVLPLGGVLASGWVMFHMHDDEKILAVSSAAALSAVVGALLLARWIVKPLERLRTASAQLAAGDLATRAPQEGARRARRRWAASFNAMAESIERLFDARRELVAWASHDLRTPLTSMQAMLEAAEDGLADPAEYLPALNDQVRTLSMLVDDLFELARIDAGVLRLELHDADLDTVIESCLRGVEADARAKRVRLQTAVRGAAAGCSLRARKGRARALQPPHQRPPPHAGRRSDRRRRETAAAEA